MINFSRFFKSLVYACRGLGHAFREEQNFRVQVVAAFIAIAIALILKVNFVEATILALAMASVFILELINTIVERITDVLKPRLDPYALVIKNLSAAAVFVASLAALLIGIFIFVPRILG